MHSVSIILIVAVLLGGAIAFGRGGDGAMPAQTRIVLIVSGLAVVILTVWLMMRPAV